MRFVVDVQLPAALAAWLAGDAAVIVTKDEDLAVIAQLRSAGPPVIWIRFGDTRKAELSMR